MSASLITFYSFKGGVGRTQALANVAVALARKGKHVIIVDLDLESPGLHRFFMREVGRPWSDEELASSEHRGVIEYFEEAAKLPDDEPRLSFLPCAHPQVEPGRGSIRMVLPGCLDGTYPERVARLSFDELYRSFGYDLVEAFRRQLVDASADFVLVDSRTGMSDVAGVCTFQLPDVVVALFALHRQGIEGVHQVAQAIERARALAVDGRKRELLLVPARVDETGEIEKRDHWVREAQRRMRDIDAKLLGELRERIPYEPRVAFGEEIVVGLAPSLLSEAYENLTEQILALVEPLPAPLPLGSRMHLRRNPQFVGRTEQLRALARVLQTDGRTAIGQAVSLSGLGGIGKTQLAIEFVHRYGQFFTGGVFWLNFADPASVATEFAQCGGPGHLGLWNDENAPDLATQVARVRSVFAGPEPRLLVFDNCEDEALLKEWLPASGGCRVLVTSRRAAFSSHLVGHTVFLDVLPRPDSMVLLRSLVRCQASDHTDDATLDAICAELGDLPLALHLAGSFLAHYGTEVTPAAYLAQLRSAALLDHPSLQGRGAEASPTGHDLHGGRTFALSWDRLAPENAVDAIARDLLQRAAYLAPGEPIPHALLMVTLGKSERDLDAALARSEALQRLRDLGLLDEPAPGTYRIHRLVMAFVRQTSGDHAAARTAVERALLDEADGVNASGYPAWLLPWQPHLRAVTDAARAREDQEAANLCAALAEHLYKTGDYRAARPYCEHALAIREKQLGPEHPDTAESLNNLGVLFHEEGALAEARSLTERALTIHEKQLGLEHPDTAVSLNNLAMLLRDQGALAEARPLFERALAIREKRLGAEHPATAESLDNLALLVQDQGALSEARTLFERALAIRETQLGPEHPATALSLNNLASLLQVEGALGEARSLLERALAIREKHLGPEHPGTAISLNNLALVLRDQGVLSEARALFERALAIYEAMPGSEHRDMRVVQGNLDSLPKS